MKIFELDDKLNVNPGEKKEIEKVSEVLPIIKEKCSKVYHLSKQYKSFISRGSRTNNKVFVSKTIDDRNPLHSNIHTQKLVDKFMQESGAIALRKNSIFTYVRHKNHMPHKDLYGNIFLIFPFDGFNYTWLYDVKSKIGINDLHSILGNMAFDEQQEYLEEKVLVKHDKGIEYLFGEKQANGPEFLVSGQFIAIHNQYMDYILESMKKDNDKDKETNELDYDIKETASAGSTSAGGIASVANPLRGISRRPSIFGYVEARPKKKKKKKKTDESVTEAANRTYDSDTGITVGPHNKKEYELMMAGKKPAALVVDLNEFPWRDAEKEGKVKITSFYNLNNNVQYIVTLPNEEWRAKKIENVFNVARDFIKKAIENKDNYKETDYKKFMRKYHIALGILLGYPKDAIRKFISLNEAKKPWLRVTPTMLQQARNNKCQIIAEVPIIDFLKLTTRNEEDIEQIKKNALEIRQYNKFSKAGDNDAYRKHVNRNKTKDDDDYLYGSIIMPFLFIEVWSKEDGRVKGHEGRHRAASALAAGQKTLTVALCLRGNFQDESMEAIYNATSELLPEMIWGQYSDWTSLTEDWKILKDGWKNI